MGRGCLGLTSWEQVREQLKYNKQGDVHFQSWQGSLGERVFAAGEATPYLTINVGAASPAHRSARLSEGQGLGLGEQIGAHFEILVLALSLHR